MTTTIKNDNWVGKTLNTFRRSIKVKKIFIVVSGNWKANWSGGPVP